MKTATIDCVQVEKRNEFPKVLTYNLKITSDLTNSEGNMTHYEHVRIFSQVIELYTDNQVSVYTHSSNISFKYIKDILPRQMIIVTLWIDKIENNSITFFCTFTDRTTGDLHAVGVQKIFETGGIKMFFPRLDIQSKAGVQLKKLDAWSHNKKVSSKYTHFVYSLDIQIDFGRTSYTGDMSTYEYAHIFGETRERFGLHCIPRFRKEVGKKYVLIINEAHYSIFDSIGFGEKIHVKMWIQKNGKAFFILNAEYFKGRRLCAIATQKIAYLSLLTGKLVLPTDLKRRISLIEGQSTPVRSFLFRMLITFYIRLCAGWRTVWEVLPQSYVKE